MVEFEPTGICFNTIAISITLSVLQIIRGEEEKPTVWGQDTKCFLFCTTDGETFVTTLVFALLLLL